MSKSLFTPRKQLRPSVQQILGRIEDPVEREVLTVAKLAKSANTAKVVSELLKPHAIDEHGWKLVQPKADWDAQITALKAAGRLEDAKFLESNYEPIPKGIHGLGALADTKGGLMAQRQVMDALQVGAGHGVITGDDTIMAMLNRIPKAAHTLYNPATHIHNVVQAPLMAMAAGVNPLTFPGQVRRFFSDARRLEWAKQDGILDAHLGAGEFRRAADNFEKMMTPGPSRVVGKIHEAVKSLYGKPDQWARGAVYNKFIDEGLGRGMAEAEARRFAVEMTNRYTQNYSGVAPAVGLLRNIPLVNPFISYSAEMLRIIKNLAEDVAFNKNGRRFQSAGALTAVLGVGAGLQALIQHFTTNDEDKEKLKQLIPILPTYMHGRTQAQVSRDPKTGTTGLLNLNPWMPAEDFIQTAKNIYNGDWDALAQTNPVAGLDRSPLLNVLMESKTGKDTATGQPTTPLQSAQQNILPGWFPGIPGVTKPNYQAAKIAKGFTRNQDGTRGITDASGRKETPTTALLSLAGVTVAQENPRRLMQRQIQDKKDAVNQIKTDARRILRSDINDEDRQAIIDQAKEKARKILGR
jgi:hypothetical protein